MGEDIKLNSQGTFIKIYIMHPVVLLLYYIAATVLLLYIQTDFCIKCLFVNVVYGDLLRRGKKYRKDFKDSFYGGFLIIIINPIIITEGVIYFFII
jgi:hypothetical protein